MARAVETDARLRSSGRTTIDSELRHVHPVVLNKEM